MSTWRPELVRRLEGARLRPAHEAEIIEELSQHLDDRVRDLIAGGATEDDARHTALADLDAPGELARRLAAILERAPLNLPPPGAPSRGRWLAARWQDVRYSVRSLRRSPAFAATVVITLGLTIGPTTALLSIGSWLLWRPAPGVTAPDRLGYASFAQDTPRTSIIKPLSYLNLDDLRRASRTVTAISGTLTTSTNVAAGPTPAREALASFVTADFFETLGVRAVAGRTFQAEDDQLPAGAHVAILSDGFARRAFGSPAEALDKPVMLNGRSMTVVGVMPPDFVGTEPLRRVSVWCPGAAYEYVHHFTSPTPVTRAKGLFSSFVVRVADGSSFAAANAELDALLSGLVQRHPEDNLDLAKARVKIVPGVGLAASQRNQYASLLQILLAIGGVLVALGCANVANLMIVRGVRGQRDRAVRLALGASRTRLLLLQLTESLLLAMAGAVLGIALAYGLKDFLAALLHPVVAMWPDFTVPLDVRVLAMTLALSVGCGLIAGVGPAVLGTRTKASRLPNHDGGPTIARARRWRGGLAAAQLAASLALVTGSLLLVTTLRNFAALDLGFDPAGVTVHRLDPSRQGYSRDASFAYYEAVFRRLESAPGFQALSLSATAFGSNRIISVQDPVESSGKPIATRANAVSADFFHVLGIRIVAGRPFTEAEAFARPESAPPLVLLSEALARRLFKSTDPVGRQIVLPATKEKPPRELTVIGMTRDVNWSLTGDPVLEMFLPFSHHEYGLNNAALMIKSDLNARVVAERVDATAMSVDPTLPVRTSSPFAMEIGYRLRKRTTFAWVLSMLGWLGLLLASVGLCGLLAQSVVERTREFGIRVALGSGRARILGLVARQAAWISAVGVVGGLALAYWGSQLIEAQLFGVSRSTMSIYAAATLMLLSVVFVASLWPARLATRIEPVEALRVE